MFVNDFENLNLIVMVYSV